MRAAIGNKLIAELPGLQAVYDSEEAALGSVKPYAVVRLTGDSELSAWAGFCRNVEIWLYGEPADAVLLDALEALMVPALVADPLETAEGDPFSCYYSGMIGADVIDAAAEYRKRGFRFAIMAVHPGRSDEAVTNDAWLNVLSGWTEAELGSAWQVYRGVWPTGYRRPAVLWRLADLEARNGSDAAWEVRRRYIGHVLGNTPDEQAAAILRLGEGLQRQAKLPLNAAERRYLSIMETKADLQANGFTGGQLSLVLQRKMTRQSEAASLMREVYAKKGQLY